MSSRSRTRLDVKSHEIDKWTLATEQKSHSEVSEGSQTWSLIPGRLEQICKVFHLPREHLLGILVLLYSSMWICSF
jgi:hypothetical protein